MPVKPVRGHAVPKEGRARHFLQVYSSSVPGTFYKLMQVLGVWGVFKLFYGKEIEVLRFWNDDRACLAPNTIKYKF